MGAQSTKYTYPKVLYPRQRLVCLGATIPPRGSAGLAAFAVAAPAKPESSPPPNQKMCLGKRALIGTIAKELGKA